MGGRGLTIGAMTLLISACFAERNVDEDTAGDSRAGPADVAVDTWTIESCRSDDDCKHWSATCQVPRCLSTGICEVRGDDGASCDDEDPCTQHDRCDDRVCRGTPYSCDDGKACTEDTCHGDGTCSYEIVAGQCLIEFECYAGGETNPANVCQACAGGESWTAQSDTPCDDGDECTVDDRCSAGTCEPGPPPDDSAGDWVKVVASPNNDDSSASVGSIARQGDHLVVAGRANGNVDLSGTTLSADNDAFVLWLDDNGDPVKHAIIGGPGHQSIQKISAIADDHLIIVGHLDENATITKPNAGQTALETTRAGAFITRLSERLNPLWTISGAPIDSSSVAGEHLVFGAALDASVTIQGPDTRTVSLTGDHGAYVAAADLDGSIRWVRTVAATGAVNFGQVATNDAGDTLLLVVTFGDLTITDQGTSTTLTTTASHHSPAGTQHALIAYNAAGKIRFLTQILRNSALGFGDRASLTFGDAGDIFVGGTFYYDEMLFLSGADSFTHVSEQFYDPTRGAGGEAFLMALNQDGRLAWTRFLHPGGGTGSSEVVVGNTDILWLAHYGAASQLETGGAPLALPASHTSLIATFDGAGLLRWYAVAIPATEVYPRAHLAAILYEQDQSLTITARVCNNTTLGFGLSATEFAAGRCRAVVMRANSAGGLTCGVTQTQ